MTEGRVGSASGRGSLLEFRRQVIPLPTGRVRVTVDVRLGGILTGRIIQVRGGWQYRPVGSGIGKRGRAGGWGVGEVWPTVEECKQAIAGEAVGESEAANGNNRH
jgi:hypothetical protein